MKRSFLKLMLILFPRPDKQISGSVGISTLLCHKDVRRYISSMRSFFYYSNYECPLYVISDGSLTGQDILLLEKTLPITVACKTPKKYQKLLDKHKWIKKYRFDQQTAIFKLKLDLLVNSPFQRNLILDSDVLFLTCPDKIISWLSSNRKTLLKSRYTREQIKKMITSRYFAMFSFRKLVYKCLNLNLNPYTSLHLLGIPSKDNLNLKKIDQVLKLLHEIDYIYKRHVDEIIFEVGLGDDQEIEYLNGDKYQNLVYGTEKYLVDEKPVMIHFPGEQKKLFWRILLTNRLADFVANFVPRN